MTVKNQYIMILKILKILQNMIKHNCSIQNLFNLAFEIKFNIFLFKNNENNLLMF